ncbi:membrane-binding protein [Methanolobus sp.]|uniref:membrane-binding protein n=1 Tax=Methanolobus sp. TaxID=1874737 RepID=UPI0025DE32B7|nr:membrane-binding protein [Methanolobus sp.]
MQTKWLFVLTIVVLAMATSGCTDSDDETVTYEEDGVTVEYTASADSEDDWCPVGSSWASSNPGTGEDVSMMITGTEEIDGVQMCKAEFNSNNPDDEYARIYYMWSEDSERFSWKYYNADGDLVSEMTMKEGQMRLVDEDGTVTEINTNS